MGIHACYKAANVFKIFDIRIGIVIDIIIFL